MTPKNNFIYSITDRLGTLLVEVLGENDFEIEYNRESDDKYFYTKKLSGKLTFRNTAYQRIMILENSMYRCENQTLKIQRNCNGTQKDIFIGIINLNDAEFNLDKCFVSVKFGEERPDQCIEDNKNTKVNLMALISNRITVKSSTPNGTIEYKNCIRNEQTPQPNDYWCGTGDPYSQNWTLISYNSESQDGVHHRVSNTWARELVNVYPNETPDPDWVLVTPAGTNPYDVYAKKVLTFNCQFNATPQDENFGSYQFSETCDIVGYSGNSTTIDNGILFNTAIVEMIKSACPTLVVKSDFFQINPDNATTTNYVTNKRSNVDTLVLFQKSDVKRPNASGNANKAEWTLEKLLETLKMMFNVKWKIENGVFRLEHVSYFSKNSGLDITLPRYKKWFAGKRIYTYINETIPKKETFLFKEQSLGGDYAMEIEYLECTSNKKNNEQKYVVDELMTDVVLALNNPDSESKVVEDTGFVLVATRKVGADYFIITEPSTNETRLNNVLAWKQLVRDFHQHERKLIRGNVNGTPTTFLSSIPTKKGEKFVIPFNVCNETFNPNDTIETALGTGIVERAKYKLRDNSLELTLLYQSNIATIQNNPPTLAGGIFSTYQGVSIDIPINPQDTDGTIESVQVAINAYHGNVQVLNKNLIRYTPTAGYTGFDVFSLKAYDNWTEPSAPANFGIEILPPNQPPVAVDETYNVFHGYPFTATPSIFSNDSDDNGFTLVNTNIQTAQGINIVINATTGQFSYVPPTGFEGTDSFQYTIIDNAGLQSTATVYLVVGYKNKPIAVADHYNTRKNVILSIDGVSIGQQKLTANDYTPDGNTYSYTCTEETKATAQGGSVQIFADGKFNYTPPSNFVGKDSFTYTVLNVNGSGIGTATIGVVPEIFVKLVIDDQKESGHIGDPLYQKTRDYWVYFYQDSAGTIPLNVDIAFGLKINIQEHHEFSDSGTTFSNDYEWQTDEVSGTNYRFYDDFVYLEQTDDGAGNIHTQDVFITLLAGNYTII